MAVDVDHALTFFDFVVERHQMYERRQAGLPQAGWTTDPVLATRKFTNVFRWLDLGSQFVITDLLPDCEPQDALFRVALYRYTNWPDTWTWLREQLGYYPTMDDVAQLTDILRQRRADGHQMFSGAYMIIPQPGRKGDKIEQVVDLAGRVGAGYTEFAACTGTLVQQARHATLTSHYGVGDFLGLQILTDYNYRFGDPTTEDEFVVEGPGSTRGTALFAPGNTPASVIRWAHRALLKMPNCPTMSGRQPSVMDIQNCFCEYSKFVKGPRNNLYRPAHPGPLPEPVLPTAYER
jgi:hypothetical protein